MGANMPYRTVGGYAPSYLSTQVAAQSPYGNNTNIVWTMGLESAKAYPLMPGRTLMLMDSESPRFFIKSVDNSGYATIKTYAFHEEQPTPPPTTSTPAEENWVTKAELEAALADVLSQMRQKSSEDAPPASVDKVEVEIERTRTKNLL